MNKGEVIKSEKQIVGDSNMNAVITQAIRQQVAVVGEIELRGNFEKLKLGAMVSEAVRRLKLDGEAQTGRGHSGGGALGWWNEVCPKGEAGEPVISYKTVMKWKQAAENLPALMGKGAPARGKLLSLMAKNPEKAVGNGAKLLSSAEKAANGMTMRQMLLWGGDDEPKKPGRPVGAAKKAEFVKEPPEKESARIWAEIKNSLENPSIRDSIKTLEPRIAGIMVQVLNRLEKMLDDRAREG